MNNQVYPLQSGLGKTSYSRKYYLSYKTILQYLTKKYDYEEHLKYQKELSLKSHINCKGTRMNSFKYVYRDSGLVQLYFFWTMISFATTVVSTSFLKNIEALSGIANYTINNNVIGRISIITLLSLLFYACYCVYYKIKIYLYKNTEAENKNRLSDSIVKTLIIGNGASISGVMYAITWYVYNNPLGVSSASEYFVVTTIFTLLMIVMLLVSFYNLNFLREELNFKIP
ncbi:hypothetical protein [Psychrobacter sp. JCM 18900]|uniref:hypothetical protein n=2 Tax=Psychrobacter sp. JCM 18900 TaxID=1298608 RepID=UPI000433BEE5|nr:hypothetical protein [Psychrobacter sp. JCM 18900]GAF51851.1 hypothetical protein JCM18900_335 [Psychrobacter sp. JCM 18900]